MASMHNGNQRMSIRVKNRKKCKTIQQDITHSTRMRKCEQKQLQKLQIARDMRYELKQSFNILCVSVKPTTKNSEDTTITTTRYHTKTVQTPFYEL